MKKYILLPLLSAACAYAETEWNTDLAYGCWARKHSSVHIGLLHMQLQQQLLPGAGGTWLSVEASGSWRVHGDDTLFDSGSHADYFGPRKLVLPEVALTQYFAGKRASITAGMVNLTNYLDAVGIANDSFATFAHSAFVNSSVLPLPDANAGGVLQVDFTEWDRCTIAVSRTGAAYGGNPFRSGPPGVCVVGEYARVFQDSGVTLRLNPFYNQHHGGVAGSVEYEAGAYVSLFARAGTANHTSDYSCGATAKLIPSRPDDFVGIAYARTKDSSREDIWELMYNVQVAEHFKIMPRLQYTRTEDFLFGIQAVVSF